MKNCFRKKQYEIDDDNNDYLEPTNENDYTDYQNLSSLSPQEREERIKELWLKAYGKARGAAIMLNQFEALKIKIQMFGRQLLVNGSKKEEQE